MPLIDVSPALLEDDKRRRAAKQHAARPEKRFDPSPT